MKILQAPSPNFFANTGEKEVTVIHKTLGLMPGTLAWLRKTSAQVSTHYLITKKGTIYQLVDEKDGAWHVGVQKNPSARWKKYDKKGVNNNRYTIGIEFECLLHETYTEKQFEAGAWLINKLDLPVVTHRDIASYKPNLEQERATLLRMIEEPPKEEKQKLIIILKLQLQLLLLKLTLLKLKRRNR